jgi:hypothetical protein
MGQMGGPGLLWTRVNQRKEVMTPSVISLGRWMPLVIKIEGREQGLGTNQHHREMHFNKSKSKL